MRVTKIVCAKTFVYVKLFLNVYSLICRSLQQFSVHVRAENPQEKRNPPLQSSYGRKLDSPLVFRNYVSRFVNQLIFSNKASTMQMLAAKQETADCILFEYFA